MSKHTPGPWFVRLHVVDDEVLDCFVTAKDVNGFAYDAEILGDDEYRDGIERKIADAHMVAAAIDMREALMAPRIFHINFQFFIEFQDERGSWSVPIPEEMVPSVTRWAKLRDAAFAKSEGRQ